MWQRACLLGLLCGLVLSDSVLVSVIIPVDHTTPVQTLSNCLESIHTAIKTYRTDQPDHINPQIEILIAQYGDRWNTRSKLSLARTLDKSIIHSNPAIFRMDLIKNMDPHSPTWSYVDTINIAAGHARGDYLFFLHPNIELDANFFKPSLASLQSSPFPSEVHFEQITLEIEQSIEQYQKLRQTAENSNSTQPIVQPPVPEALQKGIGLVSGKLIFPSGLLHNMGLTYKLHRVRVLFTLKIRFLLSNNREISNHPIRLLQEKWKMSL
jgi:hypothetical protein